MSQFEVPADQYDANATEPARTSGLAVGSLICSLIFCCPITTVLGVLLGLVALVSIGSNPARKGKGLAVAGLILGLIFTAGQAYFGYSVWKGYGIFRDAPAQALQPGFDGDYTRMCTMFAAPGQEAAAEALVAELRSRYGELQRSDLDFEAFQGMQQPVPGQTEFTLPWMLVFDGATVTAELTIRESDQGTDDTIIFSRIEVIDPDAGNLVFPPAPEPAETSGEMDEAAEGSGDTGG
ncbi:MAG: DUF4190 domain-containing protein [Planctomycetota bacterium]